MTRDPRIDPRPGDVVAKDQISRTVISRRGGAITYVSLGRRKGVYDCWITTWTAWARTSEVIHAAE
jgi:hypothetical protein